MDARKKAGLSQDKLAQLTGFSQGTISKYEKGQSKPASDFLIQVSKIFKIELEELIGGALPEEKGGDVELTPEVAAKLGFDPEEFRELTPEQQADLAKSAAAETDQVLKDFVLWARAKAAEDPLFVGYLRYVLAKIKQEVN